MIVVDGSWQPASTTDRVAAGRLLQRLQREPGEHHGYPAGTGARLPLQRQQSMDPVRNVVARQAWSTYCPKSPPESTTSNGRSLHCPAGCSCATSGTS